VDDCGRAINPESSKASARWHAHGIALRYGDSADRRMAILWLDFQRLHSVTAMNMPDLLCGHMESPSPFTFNARRVWAKAVSAGPHDFARPLAAPSIRPA